MYTVCPCVLVQFSVSILRIFYLTSPPDFTPNSLSSEWTFIRKNNGYQRCQVVYIFRMPLSPSISIVAPYRDKQLRRTNCWNLCKMCAVSFDEVSYLSYIYFPKSKYIFSFYLQEFDPLAQGDSEQGSLLKIKSWMINWILWIMHTEVLK